MRRVLFFLLAGVLFGGFLAAALAFSSASRVNSPASDHSAAVLTEAVSPSDLPARAVTSTRQIGPYVSQQAPDFSLKTLDGEEIRLQDYRGQVVLINFWTSWCPPCKEEMPVIQAAYEKYHPQGFSVLSVNMLVKDKRSDLQQFLIDQPLNFPVLLDEDGAVSNQSYYVNSIPTSFFLDAAGVIQHFQMGPMDQKQIEAYLQEMLQQDHE